MPKLFNVPWGKKRGQTSSSTSTTSDSKPGAQIFNKDNSMAVFGHTITLDDDEPQEQREPGESPVDDTVDEVLGLLPSESCCPSMSLKYVSWPSH